MQSDSVRTITPKSILVVEDEPSVAKALCVLLRIHRHRVEAVGDGETAIVKYNGGNFDLVITDFLMPGMDGLELARLIKAHTPQRPVLLITAHEETVSSTEESRLQHVDAMLVKPFSQQQLLDALVAVFPHQ